GMATLPDLRDGELAWTFAAALRGLELTVPPGLKDHTGEEATVAERAKLLRKELGRKQKAVIGDLVKTRSAELTDVNEFRNQAIAIGNRAGLLWAGDLAVVHAQLDVGKGGKSLADNPSALDLTAWSIGDDHIKLRDRLGVALKGTR
ncbi:MAG: hypothetical protein H0T46_12215, partial [Deltaproteobacteria bacterium]|nr:hypothetical protein [Deltaproteobacteria bacterium]